MPLKKNPVDPEEVKSLIHQRGQIKGKVTKIKSALDEAKKNPSKITKAVLEVYEKKLDMHYQEYLLRHREVFDVVADDKKEEQDEVLDVFDQLYTETLVLVKEVMEKLSQLAGASAGASIQVSAPIQAGANGVAPQVIVQQQPLRAPIPSFDGQPENWPKFKAMFEDLVGRTRDSDAMKLHHLDKALVGEAAGLITAKMIQDNNFEQVWKQISEEFENERVIVDTHIDGLLQLKPIAKDRLKDLQALTKACDRHVAGLQYQGLDVDRLSGLIINKLVVGRLDDSTRQQWERTQKKGELPDLNQTLQFLKTECQILERSQNSRVLSSAKEQNPKSSYPKPNPKSHTATSAKVAKSCLVCGADHRHFECSRLLAMTVPERNDKVSELKLCFNCLRAGHRLSNCISTLKCQTCHKKHCWRQRQS